MSTATVPCHPLSTLHFEPVKARPEAVVHWRRTATLSTAGIERLDVAARSAEVKVYVVAAASAVEVVCEYVAPGTVGEPKSAGFVCDFSVKGPVARLDAGLPEADDIGWLRLYVTVPSTVPLRLCEVPDA
ncbi:MAG: hypothetical protein B7733_04460 [Myxococcales bacterium FL481]|nr:MAG: hypothetical protein B7733_04460 [Myxococcales bacterium FL481]